LQVGFKADADLLPTSDEKHWRIMQRLAAKDTRAGVEF